MKKKLIMLLAVILTIALVSCTTDKKIVLNEDATNENEKLVNDMGIEVKEEELEVRGQVLTFLDSENLLTIESNENPEADGMYSQYIYNIKSKKSKKMNIEKTTELSLYTDLGDGENLLYNNSENGNLYLYNWKNDKLELLFDLRSDSEIVEILDLFNEGSAERIDKVYGCNNLVSYRITTLERVEKNSLDESAVTMVDGKSKSILIDTNTKKRYNLIFEEEGTTVEGKITYSEDNDIYYLISSEDIYSFKIGNNEDIYVEKLYKDKIIKSIPGGVLCNMEAGFIDKNGNYMSTYEGEGAPIRFLDLETMEEIIKPGFDHKNYFEINSFNYEKNYAVINANPFLGNFKDGKGANLEVYLAKIINNELVLFNKIKEKEINGKYYEIVSMFNEEGSKVLIGNREIEYEQRALFTKEVDYKLYSID